MKQRFYFIIWLALIILSSLSARAEEVDNFTPLNRLPKDSSAALNHAVNNQFDRFIQKINGNPKFNCAKDRKLLIKSFLYDFDSNFTPIGDALRGLNTQTFEEIMKDLKKKKELTARQFALFDTSKIERGGETSIESTIYKGTNILGCCVPLTNLNGNLVGIDKVDHFFGNGGQLWSVFEEEKKGRDPLSVSDILKLNVAEEHWAWGLSGTKVKSYGDLSANFAGFRFYSNLLDGENPYLKCNGKRVVINKSFDINQYVDESWDESINCSSFLDEKTVKTIKSNIANAQAKQCPVNVETCARLTKKYSTYIGDPGESFISPLCQNPDGGFNQIENAISVKPHLIKMAGGLKAIIRGLYMGYKSKIHNFFHHEDGATK